MIEASDDDAAFTTLFVFELIPAAIELDAVAIAVLVLLLMLEVADARAASV